MLWHLRSQKSKRNMTAVDGPCIEPPTPPPRPSRPRYSDELMGNPPPAEVATDTSRSITQACRPQTPYQPSAESEDIHNRSISGSSLVRPLRTSSSITSLNHATTDFGPLQPSDPSSSKVPTIGSEPFTRNRLIFAIDCHYGEFCEIVKAFELLYKRAIMNVTVNIGERTCTLTIRWLRQNLYIQVFHAQRGNAPRPSMRCYPMRHDQRFWEADLTIIEKLHKAAVAGGAAFGDAITFNEHILYAPDDNMRRNIGDRNSIMQNGCGDKLYMAQDLAYYLLAQGSPIAARSSSGYSKLSPHDVGQYFSEMQWRARVEWESYMMNKQLSSPPKRSSHYPDLAAANKRVTKIPISTIPVSRAPTPAPQKTLPALPSPPTPPMPSLSSRVTTVGPINHYGYEPQVVPAHQNGPPRQDKGTGAMDAESTRSPDTPFQHHEMPARNNRFSGEDPFHWENESVDAERLRPPVKLENEQ